MSHPSRGEVIDVERLAQAMWNREKAFLPVSMVHPWESLPDAERALVIAEAAPLAAEYDRLTSESIVVETTGGASRRYGLSPDHVAGVIVHDWGVRAALASTRSETRDSEVREAATTVVAAFEAFGPDYVGLPVLIASLAAILDSSEAGRTP